MKRMSAHLLLALGLALLAGCSASSETGSAQLAVSVPQALSASISRVSVTASAPDFSSVSMELVSSDGVWGGTLGNLPAGAHRSFLAQAFDASDTLLFEGSASGVSISADQTFLVAITLQQVNAPPPLRNEAPVIDSLVASTTGTSVSAGSTLSLVATAHDPNPGDTLAYVWSSTAGAFSSNSEATTSWTAPASTGIQTLTFTVTDSGGLSSSISLAVYVIPSPLPGQAQFSISFNTAPQVTALDATPTRVAVGQTTSVSASVSDPDGDSLTYAWSASCVGSWANASSSAASFTPSALPAGACNNCRLTVTVSDGRGGQTTGTVALCVSNAPIINHFNPVILAASRSSDTAAPGQVLTYEVVASDPEGSALSFSWAANAGGLGTPTTDVASSRITWTAPSCVRANTPTTITATVTNAFNLTATKSFSVTGLPTCPGWWTSAGTLSTLHSAHTTTRLLNGKVLVAGDGGGGRGNSTVAELYDPASGTWKTTGSMRTARYRHRETLLLNGRVLVTGGYIAANNSSIAAAELYDPASGIWLATAPMLSARNSHTSTLLPDGKVLVTGGNNLATAEVYDPASGTWSYTAPMTGPRTDHTATPLLDGKVLIAGNSRMAEVYDPASGTWSPTGPMVSSRDKHTATRLTDGKVLVTGGGFFLATAEVYDPASGTWSATGSMAWPRLMHTAALLPDGKVLVSGGQTSSGPPVTLATAELYDPASGTWSATGSMTAIRQTHTATPLLNGKVLVVGSNAGSQSMTAELYTPELP